MPKKKIKTDAFEAIHESALALHSVGAIDKATMREFDEACLIKTPIYDAKQIRKIREEAKVIKGGQVRSGRFETESTSCGAGQNPGGGDALDRVADNSRKLWLDY